MIREANATSMDIEVFLSVFAIDDFIFSDIFF